jgi:hypothetical protein
MDTVSGKVRCFRLKAVFIFQLRKKDSESDVIRTIRRTGVIYLETRGCFLPEAFLDPV